MTSSSQGSGTGREGESDGWLSYDGPDRETADAAGPGPAGAADRTAGADAASSDDGPWLRFELTELSEQDGAAGNRSRDPSWLEPELTPVSGPEAVADDEADHDTGVPPTLVEPQLPEPGHEPELRPAPLGERAAHEDVARIPAATPGDAPANDTAAGDTAAGDTAAGDTAARDTAPRPAAGNGPRRVGRRSDGAQEPVGALGVLGAAVKELVIVVGMALVLSFIVKSWLIQAFYIPSGSMEDTLQVDDRVIVSKLTPGPIDLRRGDIVVFADPGDWLEPVVQQPHGTVVTVVRDTLMFVGLLPDNSENHLIKRVIGLPGDHVKCCDEGGRITVNGVPIKEPYLMKGNAASESEFDITVPRGRVWVMGDHRSDSSDSRFHDAPENNGTQGSVDERLIVGRAVAIVWPLDHVTWLSTPTQTFAKVPNPSPHEDQGDSPDAPGEQAPPPGEAPPGGGD